MSAQPYDPGRAARRARAFLVELESGQQGNFDVMLRHYQQAREALILDIERITKGVPSAAQLPLRQDELLRVLDNRIAAYLKVVNARGKAIAKAAAAAGLETGGAQMREWGIAQGVDVNAHAVGSLLGTLDDPLSNPLSALGPAARGRATQLLSQAVINGWGPRRVAREMAATGDMVRSRAELIARTEMMRAYREGNLQQWQANAGIVQGWIWLCHPSIRTCPVCFSQHGTLHPLSESLTSHPNCRCTMLPVPMPPPGVDGDGMLRSILGSVEPGEDILKRMPVAHQQAILGRARWEKWQGGTPLRDMIRSSHHPIYGEQRRLIPLRELDGGTDQLKLELQRKLRPSAPPPPPAAPPEAQWVQLGGPAKLELTETYQQASNLDATAADVAEVDAHARRVFEQLGLRPPAYTGDIRGYTYGGKGSYIASKRKAPRAHYRTGPQFVEVNASLMGKSLREARKAASKYSQDGERIVKAGFANTVLHEYGHHIDFTNRTTSSMFRGAGTDVHAGAAERRALLQAMHQSSLYAELSRHRNRFGHIIAGTYSSYLRSEHEMIARAFQQWAAKKARDDDMLRYLDGHGAQWPFDKDWDYIEEAMEKWLRAIGWM